MARPTRYLPPQTHDPVARIFVLRVPGMVVADDQDPAAATAPLFLAAAVDNVGGTVVALGLYAGPPIIAEVADLVTGGCPPQFGALGLQWATKVSAIEVDLPMLWGARVWTNEVEEMKIFAAPSPQLTEASLNRVVDRLTRDLVAELRLPARSRRIGSRHCVNPRAASDAARAVRALPRN